MNIFTKLEFANVAASFINCAISIVGFSKVIKRLNVIDEKLTELSNIINTEIVCNIIYPLSAAFSQVVREYVAQYYYLKEKRPNNYPIWVNTLLSICDDAFTQKIRGYLLNSLEGTMVDKMKLVNSMIINSIEAVENIEYTKYLVESIGYYDYKNFDELLMYKCRIGQCSFEEDINPN